MREILFRGKRTDNGKWVYGYLCKGYSMPAPHTFDGIMYENHSTVNLAYTTARIDPETVGQYTGLKDRNGKKIFEGDILSLKNPEPYRNAKAIVRYNQLSWVIAFDRWGDYFLQNFMDDDIEIIGNIYDNPELIGGVLNV